MEKEVKGLPVSLFARAKRSAQLSFEGGGGGGKQGHSRRHLSLEPQPLHIGTFALKYTLLNTPSGYYTDCYYRNDR
jgi:hypothetical protein